MSGIGELPELMEELIDDVTLPESWCEIEQNRIDFSDRAKEIIKEVSAFAQQTAFYKDRGEQVRKWREKSENRTASEVYLEILCKTAEAPGAFVAEFVAIGLMPELSRKLGLEE